MKSEINIQKFSARLRGLRARRGLTQADLAAKVGVSIGSVGNWESEQNFPSPSKLRKIADVLGVEPDYFYQDFDLPVSNKPIVVTEEKKGEDEYYTNPDLGYAQGLCPDPKAFAIQLHGESMEPKYQSGDTIVVSPNSKLYSGDLVMVKTVDDNLLLRIYHDHGDGNILLTSYHPHYPPTEITKERIKYIYPVWSVIRRVKFRGAYEEPGAKGINANRTKRDSNN